jgi:hypothetical protein
VFRRIIDVPFESCVAALESWPPAGRDGGRRTGRSLVLGPVERVSGPGICRMDVRLARGRLRPRLDIDRWTWPSAKTTLELVPGRRVRPTAAYFRAGHLLLDSLTQALSQHAAADAPPSALRPARARTARTR